MAPKKTTSRVKVADSRELLEQLHASKPAVLAVASKDTGISAEDLEPGFELIIGMAAKPDADADVADAFREDGARAARAGVPGDRVLDGYLSLNWAIWEAAVAMPDTDKTVVMGLADRLMRGIDAAIAAVIRGYVLVEVELAAAHSERRRSVLEELLTAPRVTPEDRARIRTRAERHGLGVEDGYRLILITAPGATDQSQDEAIDKLERSIRVPMSHHREQPGIRLPLVLEWRGRILVAATASWTGEQQLHKALPRVLGKDWIAVDSGPVEGIEPLSDALAQAEYSVGVAANLGRQGWIGDTGELALETTFLLDQPLTHAAIEQELGSILADERMGDELIETLEVYLGSRQNIRETGRQLHLAPRTVAYRLERIESLLGGPIEGAASVRIGAALLALSVLRQAGSGEL